MKRVYPLTLVLGFSSACGAPQEREVPPLPKKQAARVPADPLDEFETAAHRADEATPPPPGPPILLRGATVLTATGKAYSPGYLLLEGGRIREVGPGDGTAPSTDTKVMSYSGHFITPGFIDPHSHLGVYGNPASTAQDEVNEMTDPIGAGLEVEHGIWPQDPGFGLALRAGVTTAAILPGSGNLVGGRGITVHLTPKRGARAMRFPGAPGLIKLACGENPRRTYGEQKRTPTTRMAGVRLLREALIRAQKYIRDWDDFRSGKLKDARPPDRDLTLQSLALLLRGKLLAEWHCYRADDMLTALEIADEFGFRVRAFHHALEAYKIRDVLSARGVGVVTWDDSWGFKLEAYDGIPENLALVTESKGIASMHSDSPVLIQMLGYAAGRALFAGKRGSIHVTEDDALKWVTSEPSWVLGLENEVGTLEPGKRADVVVWRTHPLRGFAKTEAIFVDGQEVRPEASGSDFTLGQPTVSEPVAAPSASSSAEPPHEKRPPPQRPTFVLEHARALTPGGMVEDAHVVIAGDRIAAIGRGPSPNRGETIDVQGGWITPGFVDSASTLGIEEITLEPHSVDTDGRDPFVPGAEAASAFNRFSAAIPLARRGGVTGVVVTPASGFFAGHSAFAELVMPHHSESAIRRSIAEHVRLDEGTVNTFFGARGVAFHKLREVLEEAKAFATHRKAFEENKARPFSLSAHHLEALRGVVENKEPLVVRAERAADIEALLALFEAVPINFVLAGASEGWMVAAKLRERKVPVIVDALPTLASRFDQLHARADNAALLHRAGVTVLLSTFGSHNVRDLRHRAAFAISQGMPHDAALRAVTQNPAHIFSLPGQGRLEAGAVANLVVWSGDPFALASEVRAVFVRGIRDKEETRQEALLKKYRTLGRP